MKKLLIAFALSICAFGQTSNYPSALDTNSSLFVAVDNCQSYLTVAMGTGDATATVQSGLCFAANMVIIICDTQVTSGPMTGKCTAWELMKVTGVVGNVLSVTRGFGGTVARTHAVNRLVSNTVSRPYTEALKSAVIAIETALGANLSNVYRNTANGVVTVYPPVGGVSSAYAPDGTAINCVGSTTSCLQEADNYRLANSMSMRVVGGGCDATGCTEAVYMLTTPWNVNILEIAGIWGDGPSTFNCTSAIGANACIKFDSTVIGYWRFPGSQVVTFGTGPAIEFHPRTVPPDVVAGPGMGVFDFELGAPVQVHTPSSDLASVPLIKFNLADGPINTSWFKMSECNGSGQAILVTNSTVSNTFLYNHVSCPGIHSDVTTAGNVVQVATNAGGGANILNNQWDLTISSANTGKGYSTYEQFGRINLVTISGTQSYGLFFESGAAGNTAHVGQMAGVNYTSGLLSVGGDCAKNQLIGISTAGHSQFGIPPSGSPFTYTNSTCQDVVVIVQGGTVSQIDSGVTGSLVNTGLTAGSFYLKSGMGLKVTYAVAPSITGVI